MGKRIPKWLEAWEYCQAHKDIPQVLYDVAKRKMKTILKNADKRRTRLPDAVNPGKLKEKLRADLERLCKAIVKRRDLQANGLGYCITCKKPSLSLQWGHFVKQSMSEWLRYDPRNTAMQCESCNIWQEGRHFEFGQEIDKREDCPGYAAALVQEAKDHRNWQPTIDNLEDKLQELRKMWEDGCAK